MPNLRTFSWKSLSFFLLVFVMVAAFYLPVYSTESAMARHVDGSCAMKNTEILLSDGEECQMSRQNSSCLMEQSRTEKAFSVCDETDLKQTGWFF